MPRAEYEWAAATRTAEHPAAHQISKWDQRCLLALQGSVDPRPHSSHGPQETIPCEHVGWEGIGVLLDQALLYLLPLDLKEMPACRAAGPARWALQLRAEQLKLFGVKGRKQNRAAADLLSWQACNCLKQLNMMQPTGSLKGCNDCAG